MWPRREPTKNSVLINGIGKVAEVHVGERKIDRHGANLGRNYPEGAARRVEQIHHQNGFFRMVECHVVDEEGMRPVWRLRGQGRELLCFDTREGGVVDDVHMDIETS